jgi:uncharacterized protein
MKLMNTGVMLLAFSMLLTACQTVTVKEKHFLLPDKPITQAWLDTQGQGQLLERILIPTEDGLQLGGTLITRPDAKLTILYFGGNDFRVNVQGAEIAEDLGVFDNNLLIVDHRGYGMSQGAPSVDILQRDAVTVFDYAKSHPQLGQLPILVHGLSLGSMIAGALSNSRPIDGLVLEGSTTNVEDMINQQIPWFAAPFIRLNLDESVKNISNLDRLNAYRGPLLILVGENDDQTPLALSETLFKQAKSANKRLLVVPDKKHGNATSGANFVPAYRKFIASVLADKNKVN